MPDIDVIIPSWNGKDLLAECLDSLAEQSFKQCSVLVVDDASTDGTAEMVRQRYPWVNLLTLDKNGGFCKAVNAGIRNGTAEYVFLLNNDVTLHPQCLELLIAEARKTGAALVAPLILWRDQPHIVYSAGDCQHANGRPEAIGYRMFCDSAPYKEDVFGISAAAGLYKREIFDRLGMLDEKFGTYFSDSDLSFRARLAGHRARFVQNAVAWHVGSASLGGSTYKRTRECFINHALLVIKNMPWPLLLLNAWEILRERYHQSWRMWGAACMEYGNLDGPGHYFHACLQMYCLIPHALRERRRIQRARTATSREIDALFWAETEVLLWP